jgi:hypothetical protein
MLPVTAGCSSLPPGCGWTAPRIKRTAEQMSSIGAAHRDRATQDSEFRGRDEARPMSKARRGYLWRHRIDPSAQHLPATSRGGKTDLRGRPAARPRRQCRHHWRRGIPRHGRSPRAPARCRAKRRRLPRPSAHALTASRRARRGQTLPGAKSAHPAGSSPVGPRPSAGPRRRRARTSQALRPPRRCGCKKIECCRVAAQPMPRQPLRQRRRRVVALPTLRRGQTEPGFP